MHTKLIKTIKPVAQTILTLGPIGLLPAPGTMASIVTCIAILCIQPYNHQIEIAYGALFICGYIAARITHNAMHPDPSEYVLDEVVGMLITLSFGPRTVVACAIGCILFRFFDILKPLGISTIQERFKGPLGIFLDDMVAGVYALIMLTIIKQYGLIS